MADTKIASLTDGLTTSGTDRIPVAISPYGSGNNAYITPSYLKTFMVTGGTVTSSTPVFDMSQTWNAGAVAFSGLKFNVTDTASASASLFVDLQIGGNNKFSIRKDGSIDIYNAWSSAGANYERASHYWSSNIYTIATQANGTGISRGMMLSSAGNLYFASGGIIGWAINSSGHLLAWAADNTYDLGSNAANRARDFHLGRNLVIGMTQSLGGGVGVINIGNANTAPTTDPTGGGILYCEGGALKYRGTSGTVTTIASA